MTRENSLATRRGGARHGRPRGALLAAGLLLAAAAISGQQVGFEQVATGLTDADPAVRLRSMRLFAESGYVEAAAPLAVLLLDPLDDIQLEAIATETTLLAGGRFAGRAEGSVARRNDSVAQAAFWSGPDLPVRPAPVEVVRGLLAAMSDDDLRVRLEATYAFGALAAPDLDQADPAEVSAAFNLLAGRLTDPDVSQRLAASAVTGRLLDQCRGRCLPPDPGTFGDRLIDALNDRDRFIRLNTMWALGLLRHERAVQALTDQLAHYKRGAEAEAALEALAQIAHRSSGPLFWATLAGSQPVLRRHAIDGIGRLGDAARAADLEAAVARDRDAGVQLALAFARHRLGRASGLDRLIEGVYRATTRAQARGYLIEIGASVADSLAVYLRDPSPEVRALLAGVLGRVGGTTAIPALEPLAADRDPAVVAAAARAIARLRRQK